MVLPAAISTRVLTTEIPEGPEHGMQLRKGGMVISSDGQTIGTLDRVITDPKNDRVTHLVISSGLLIKKRKLIPVHWLGDVFNEQVHLSVGARLLCCLIEFRPES